MKMNEKALTFDKNCINKNIFHKNKRRISIDKVDIKRIVLSKKNLYGKKGSFKYFIGYINETDALPVPLCIKLTFGYLLTYFFPFPSFCTGTITGHKEEGDLRNFDNIFVNDVSNHNAS